MGVGGVVVVCIVLGLGLRHRDLTSCCARVEMTNLSLNNRVIRAVQHTAWAIRSGFGVIVISGRWASGAHCLVMNYCRTRCDVFEHDEAFLVHSRVSPVFAGIVACMEESLAPRRACCCERSANHTTAPIETPDRAFTTHAPHRESAKATHARFVPETDSFTLRTYAIAPAAPRHPIPTPRPSPHAPGD